MDNKLQLEAILNTVSDGFVIIDKDFNIQDFVSKASFEILGSDDLSGKSFFDVFRPHSKETKACADFDRLVNCLRGGFNLALPNQFDVVMKDVPKSIKITEVGRKKEAKVFEFRISPIVEQNKIQQIAISFTDITTLAGLDDLQTFAHKSTINTLDRLIRIAGDSHDKEALKGALKELMKQMAATKDALADIPNQNIADISRQLHIVKGIVTAFDLKFLKDLIIKAEDILTEISTDTSSVEGNKFEQLAEYGQNIFRGINSLNTIWNKIGSDKTSRGRDVKPSTFPWEAYSSNLARSALAHAAHMKKEIDFKIDAYFAPTGNDLSLVKRTLNHIVRNAIDHGIEAPSERTKAGKRATGVVDLKVDLINEIWHVTVRDDGQGIDRNKLIEWAQSQEGNTISAPFTNKDALNMLCQDGFTSKEELSETSGRGIGMSCVKTELNKLGGTTSLEETSENGSCFKISWKAKSPALPLKQRLEPTCILLVDDEEALLDLMETIVEDLGHKVLTATNGQEALEILDKESVDVLVTDVDMPIKSGLALISEIPEEHSNIEKIIVTGKLGNEFSVTALKLGVTYFLKKPFKPAELRDIVESAVAKKRLIESAIEPI